VNAKTANQHLDHLKDGLHFTYMLEMRFDPIATEMIHLHEADGDINDAFPSALF